jgi:hypothetical protein
MLWRVYITWSDLTNWSNSSLSQGELAQEVTTLTCIRKVSSLNPGWDINHPGRSVVVFLNRSRTIPGMARCIGHRCFLPRFSSSFTDTVWPSDAVKPDLLTVLSNQLQWNERTQQVLCYFCKASYTLSVKLSDFTVWCNSWRKNWENCAALTGNNADIRTVLSSRLSHTKLQRIPQFPPSTYRHHDGIISGYICFQHFIQQMSIAWYIPFQIPLLTPHFTLSFLLFG